MKTILKEKKTQTKNQTKPKLIDISGISCVRTDSWNKVWNLQQKAAIKHSNCRNNKFPNKSSVLVTICVCICIYIFQWGGYLTYQQFNGTPKKKKKLLTIQPKNSEESKKNWRIYWTCWFVGQIFYKFQSKSMNKKIEREPNHWYHTHEPLVANKQLEKEEEERKKTHTHTFKPIELTIAKC